jgi:RNA polymerase sigma factor (sigma-70 family)
MHLHSPTFVPAPARVPALADDGELLRRSAADDQEAFSALFARHRDGLQGFLFRKLRSYEDAEDAVTLTFSNAWRARSTFRGEASGKAWLYRIATRVALDMLRARRRRPAELELDARPVDLLEPFDDVTVDPIAVTVDAERVAGTRAAVGQALDRLPDDERLLLRLFYFDEYNYDQISHLLGVSRSQVRGRLHRIRGRIRKDLVSRQQWQPS